MRRKGCDSDILGRQLQQNSLRHCMAPGPGYGRTRNSAHAHASSFALPSFRQGLRLAALEAISWELPSLLSSHGDLAEVFHWGGPRCVDPEACSLSEELRRFCRTSAADCAAMAQAAQAPMAQLYSWILGGGEPPEFLPPAA